MTSKELVEMWTKACSRLEERGEIELANSLQKTLGRFQSRPGLVIEENKVEQAGGDIGFDATEYFVEMLLASKDTFTQDGIQEIEDTNS